MNRPFKVLNQLPRHTRHYLCAKPASVVTTCAAFGQRWPSSSRHAPPLGKDRLCHHDRHCLWAKMASVVTTRTAFGQNLPLSSRRGLRWRARDAHAGAKLTAKTRDCSPSGRKHAKIMNQTSARSHYFCHEKNLHELVPGAAPEFPTCFQSSDLAILAAVIPHNAADRSATNRIRQNYSAFKRRIIRPNSR